MGRPAFAQDRLKRRPANGNKQLAKSRQRNLAKIGERRCEKAQTTTADRAQQQPCVQLATASQMFDEVRKFIFACFQSQSQDNLVLSVAQEGMPLVLGHSFQNDRVIIETLGKPHQQFITIRQRQIPCSQQLVAECRAGFQTAVPHATATTAGPLRCHCRGEPDRHARWRLHRLPR